MFCIFVKYLPIKYRTLHQVCDPLPAALVPTITRSSSHKNLESATWSTPLSAPSISHPPVPQHDGSAVLTTPNIAQPAVHPIRQKKVCYSFTVPLISFLIDTCAFL